MSIPSKKQKVCEPELELIGIVKLEAIPFSIDSVFVIDNNNNLEQNYQIFFVTQIQLQISSPLL